MLSMTTMREIDVRCAVCGALGRKAELTSTSWLRARPTSTCGRAGPARRRRRSRVADLPQRARAVEPARCRAVVLLRGTRRGGGRQAPGCGRRGHTERVRAPTLRLEGMGSRRRRNPARSAVHSARIRGWAFGLTPSKRTNDGRATAPVAVARVSLRLRSCGRRCSRPRHARRPSRCRGPRSAP